MTIRERLINLIDDNLIMTAAIGAITYSAIYSILAVALVSLIVGVAYVLITFLPVWAAVTFGLVMGTSLLMHLLYFTIDDGHREMRNRIRRLIGGYR